VAGVEDDEAVPPKEDTLRETPVSKASDSHISVPDDWKPPPRRQEGGKGGDLARPGDLEPPPGARVDFGFGGARVRTFQVTGPLAILVALVVLGVVGAIFALIFVFAVGAGAALAAGAAVAAALGMGAVRLRRRLSGAAPRKLDAGQDGP
jgi:hypothetical protein